MTDIPPIPRFSWSLAALKERPARYIAVTIVLFMRYFMGLFFFSAGLNKVTKGWLWSDYLEKVFQARIADLQALASPSAIDTFGLMFLEKFAVPLYPVIAYVVALGELYVGIAWFLGLTSRLAGVAAVLMMIGFAIGGYYDASLIPLIGLGIIITLTPSGHWLGMDRLMLARHPGSVWFR